MNRLTGKTVVGIPTRLFLLLAGGVLLLSGCATPPGTQRQETLRGAQLSTPRTLRIGSQFEPVEGVAVFAGSSNKVAQHTWMFHAGLTAYDPQGDLQPRIARKVPSIADGDWKVFPDGGMELTWKLRPNLKWHDGVPLSAEDFVFGIQVARDPDLPLPHTGGVSLVREVLAPDAETLVVRWSETYFGANEGAPAEMPALPRHLLADLYRQGDRPAFINSPRWSREWVGLGPYRMGEWVEGSHTEGLAFDDYALGRPKIDRVIIRYFLDPTVLATNLLSGDIDFVSVGSLRTDDLAPVRNAWDPNGGGTVIEMMTYVTWARLQFRDPSAPWVNDVRVRQALLHLIDRQTMAEAFFPGSATSPTDIFVAREDPLYRLVEQRGLSRYPYDVAQGERLLADAGWARGQDGVFQNGSGQRFNIEVRITANAPALSQQALALSDQWKRGGLESEMFAIASNATNKPELKANSKGVYLQPDAITPDVLEGFTTAQIQTPQNQWQGKNLSGYSNSDFDRLYAQYAGALEVPKRQSLYADVLKRTADDVLFLPLYYSSSTSTITFRRGVRGPGPVLPIQSVGTWNMHEWEVD